MTRRARFTLLTNEEYTTIEDTIKAAITAGIPVERSIIRAHDKIMIDIIYDETNGVFDGLKTLLGQVSSDNLHHHYDFTDHGAIRTMESAQELSDSQAHTTYQSAEDEKNKSTLQTQLKNHPLNIDGSQSIDRMAVPELQSRLSALNSRLDLIHAHITHNPAVNFSTAKTMSVTDLRRNLKRQTAGDLRVG